MGTNTRAVLRVGLFLVVEVVVGAILLAGGRADASRRSVSLALQAPEATPDPGENWGNEHIGAHRLWQSGYTGNEIRIAVIDSGIDRGHPAFVGGAIFTYDGDSVHRDGQGVILNPDDPTADPVPRNPYDELDYTGHGTRMGSIIGASGADGQTRGVAYQAQVYSIKTDYLVENAEAETVFHRTVAPFGTYDVSFAIPITAGVHSVLDVILTWEDDTALTLEVISPTVVPADQAGGHFQAVTNLPLRGQYGLWQARVGNPDPWSRAFTLTVKQWQWTASNEDVRRAINFAIGRNVNVINLSQSTGPDLDDVILNAVSQGIVVVTSAGNTGPDPGTLSSSNRHEITVGASDQSDLLAAFSSRGPADDGNTKPDLVAPGEAIVTANSRMSFGVLNDYMVIFGTSPAAAHVSGGAALLIQYLEEITGVRPNPAVVKTMLMNTAVNVGVSGPPAEPNQVKSQKDNDSGAGQVDLYRALLSFALTGSADGPLDSDLLTVRVPAILPGAPTMPLKATSYADQAPFDAFWLSGGDLSPCFCANRDGFYSKTPANGLTMQTDGISNRL